MEAVTSIFETRETPTANVTTENVNDIGRDVFLRLLVTQLESQDPTSPLENEDFIAQLAQFSSLEQTTQMNNHLESLVGENAQRQKMDAVNFIGRAVVAEGDVVPLPQDKDATISYVLDRAAKVTIDILDLDGRVIGNLGDPTIQDAGEQQVVWNGALVDRFGDQGDRLDAGAYRYRVNAKDLKTGSNVEVVSYMKDRVKNVIVSEDQPVLTLESGKPLLAKDVLSVEAL